jgi:hypothetical protein
MIDAGSSDHVSSSSYDQDHTRAGARAFSESGADKFRFSFDFLCDGST